MAVIKPYREKLRHRPAREMTCIKCGVKFYVKGSGGSAKYCIECRVEVYEENQKKRKKLRR